MTITVTWRRTLNVKPYETEVLELGISETVDLPPVHPSKMTERTALAVKLEADVFRALAKEGDKLTTERLALYGKK